MNTLFIIALILFIIGFILIAVELIIPGFGAPGISGGICLIIGVFLAADNIYEGIYISVVLLVLLAVLVFLVVTLLAKGKLKSPIILSDSLKKEDGYISSEDLNYLIGKKGKATTALRPAGKIKVEDVEFDVISDGRFINVGDMVEIYKISNSSLVVREIDDNSNIGR